MRVSADGNSVNYVELDGHMALVDETGGKPLTGYGSGANTGSPVATPEESAAMAEATAAALVTDLSGMCRSGGGYAFDGEFCQAAIKEAWGLKHEANVFRNISDQRAVKSFVYDWGPTIGGVGCVFLTAGVGAIVCGSAVAAAEFAKASRDIRSFESRVGVGGAVICLGLQMKTRNKRIADGCVALVTGITVGNALSKGTQQPAKRSQPKTPQDDR